jgi:hypothetical protein
MMSGEHHASLALSPGKNPGTYFIGGWAGVRDGMDVLVKKKTSFSSGIRIPD